MITKEDTETTLIGQYNPDTSTDNTHFYTLGAECEHDQSFSAELVFTCCAPNHKSRENHINSVAKVAPCFFILEACVERACSPERLQESKPDTEEVEILATQQQQQQQTQQQTQQHTAPDRLPASMLHIDVKDILKKMLDSGSTKTTTSATIMPKNMDMTGAVNIDSILDVIRIAFSGLGSAGEADLKENEEEDAQQVMIGGPNTAPPETTETPQFQVIQLDNSMLQSLLQTNSGDASSSLDVGKVQLVSATTAAAVAAAASTVLAAAPSGDDNLALRLMEKIKEAVKDGKLQELLMQQQQQAALHGTTTTSREEAARKKFQRRHSDSRGQSIGRNDDIESPLPYMSEELRLSTRDAVGRMFQRSYDQYMSKAFPWDELLPISCSGTSSPLTGGGALTLVDALDTLVVMKNYTEFVSSVWRVKDTVTFDLDLNVSVFETTIRVMGGLVSGHMLSSGLDVSGDGDGVHQKIEEAFVQHGRGKYDGCLLEMAVDIANRLMPAFETNTGIPIGTVNLLHGVPVGETDIASTAGGGSLYMEFGMLSSLTGNATYALKSRQALMALYERANVKTGLVGMHINTKDGKWTERLGGIGSNVDSFYEYLYKVIQFGSFFLICVFVVVVLLFCCSVVLLFCCCTLTFAS